MSSANRGSSGRFDREDPADGSKFPLLRTLAENVTSYFLDRSAYLRSMREYLAYQVEYRSGKMMGGTIFLLLGAFFLIGASFALMGSLYQLLLDYTANAALSAFIIGWICVFIGFLFLIISRKSYKGIARSISYQEWKNRKEHRRS